MPTINVHYIHFFLQNKPKNIFHIMMIYPLTLKIFFYRPLSTKQLYTSLCVKSPLVLTPSLGSQSVSRFPIGSSSTSSGSIFPQSITQNSPTREMPNWTKTAHAIPKNIAYLLYSSNTKKNNPEISVGKSTKFS